MDKNKYLSPREYEMLAILLPDQGEDETKAAIEKMLSYITDEQGTVDSVAADSPWGRRRLAYTVRHEGVDYRDGHYVLVYFTAMPNVLTEIERELKLDVNVIRYLLLTQDPHMGEKIDPAAVAAAAEIAEEESAAAAYAAETAAVAAAAAEATKAAAAEAEVNAVPATDEPAAEEAEAVSEEPVAEVAAAESVETEVAEVAEVEETVVEEDATEEAAAEGDVEKAAEE